MLDKKKPAKKTYTVTIIPEDGSETKGYTNVTREQVAAALATFLFLVVLVVFFMIAFTPVRKLIPGYGTAKEYEKRIVQTQERLDSLTTRLIELDMYNQRLRGVLGIAAMPKDTSAAWSGRSGKATPRSEFALASAPNLVGQAPTIPKKYPAFIGSIVRGTASQEFWPEKSHYGFDIATAANEPIGAMADGTVLFADWTFDYGHTVIIDHGGLISFYKHCNQIFVREGSRVRRGEVIALAGSTGHETTGPHLHLEIWKNGVPQNPEDYLEKNK